MAKDCFWRLPVLSSVRARGFAGRLCSKLRQATGIIKMQCASGFSQHQPHHVQHSCKHRGQKQDPDVEGTRCLWLCLGHSSNAQYRQCKVIYRPVCGEFVAQDYVLVLSVCLGQQFLSPASMSYFLNISMILVVQKNTKTQGTIYVFLSNVKLIYW